MAIIPLPAFTLTIREIRNVLTKLRATKNNNKVEGVTQQQLTNAVNALQLELKHRLKTAR